MCYASTALFCLAELKFFPVHTSEIIKTDQDSKKPSKDQPAKATSLHISPFPPPASEQLNKPKNVSGSYAKSKLLPSSTWILQAKGYGVCEPL